MFSYLHPSQVCLQCKANYEIGFFFFPEMSEDMFSGWEETPGLNTWCWLDLRQPSLSLGQEEEVHTAG